jgi:conjugative transfer signal peptidase TraF
MMTRLGYVFATSISVIGVVVASFVSMPVKLLWNASASTPIGFYDLEPAHDLKVGDLVAVMPPQALAEFLVDRGYIGRDTPLLKRVAALPGQEVCRIGADVTVDAVPFGDALDRDRIGRDLPVWQGCRRIADRDIFVMNSSVHDSLDGRYFGPLPVDSVIGKATPLYTDENGDDRFVWRAPTR